MNRADVLRLLTVIDRPERVAEVLSALSSEQRVETFDKLYHGEKPKEIAEELDLSRSALQPYFNDFKETGLIVVDGKEYRFTDKGEHIHGILENLDRAEKDMSKLQEYLLENPDVIPEEVKQEIRSGGGG